MFVTKVGSDKCILEVDSIDEIGTTNEWPSYNGEEVVITDLCYIFSHDKTEVDLWDLLNNKIFYPGGVSTKYGCIQFGPHKIPWSNTAYGDGEYPVKIGYKTIGEFCVDAGMFAIIPMNLIEEITGFNFKPDCMVKTILHGSVRMNGDGNATIGGIDIITKDEDDDREW